MSDPIETKPARAEGQLIQAIMAHWIHLDALMWRYTQTLIALEAIFFAATYPFAPSIASGCIQVLCLIIVSILYYTTKQQGDHRDTNIDLLYATVRASISPQILCQIDRTHPLMTWSPKRKKGSGRKLRAWFFGICATLNIIASLFCFLYYSENNNPPLFDSKVQNIINTIHNEFSQLPKQSCRIL